MANADYTVAIHDSFQRLQDDIRALGHLVMVTPSEDSHWPVINMIEASLDRRFEELQRLVIQQLTVTDQDKKTVTEDSSSQ